MQQHQQPYEFLQLCDTTLAEVDMVSLATGRSALRYLEEPELEYGPGGSVGKQAAAQCKQEHSNCC